jgi:DNA-binding NtrC family response regulator
MSDETLELHQDPEGLPPIQLRIDPPDDGAVLVRLAPGDAVILGASPPADVRIVDASVSARHCRVVHHGAGIEVLDLGSRNGVWIDGTRVAKATLPLGAAFRIGRSDVMIIPDAAPAEVDTTPPLPNLVGVSPPMRRLAAAVRRIASLRLPVLLRGESGTGKDLVARAIHDESARARAPFVAINAATISRELAESELFGHQRGAFTGALRDRRGAFREAHLGTLFLDEIGALPLEVQAKLLRVVEENRCRPLGAEATFPVDVRLIAATCEPLEAMVTERRFRADLYERLAVCVIHVPPLRERASDVPLLARHLLATSEIGDRTLTPGALALLQRQRWPGNVRELRNVVVQAAVIAGSRIEAHHVATIVSERGGRVARRRIEPAEALRIYEEAGRNASAAARRAALPRSTLRDLLRAARGSSEGS